MQNTEDHRLRRCPRLGHEVSFHYCRTQESSTCCPRLQDCWWEIFDVRAFLKEYLPAEELTSLQDKPAPKEKVLSLLELIEQAKQSSLK